MFIHMTDVTNTLFYINIMKYSILNIIVNPSHALTKTPFKPW